MTNMTYIGATVEVAAGKPATIDAAGFGALSFSEIGEILEWGEIGDTSEDSTETTLKGRVMHTNGAVDGGTSDFTFLRSKDSSDTGQALLIAKNNTNDDVSFKITDPDGEISYFHGKVANVRDRARSASTQKGMTGQARINCAVVRVAA